MTSRNTAWFELKKFVYRFLLTAEVGKLYGSKIVLIEHELYYCKRGRWRRIRNRVLFIALRPVSHSVTPVGSPEPLRKSVHGLQINSRVIPENDLASVFRSHHGATFKPAFVALTFYFLLVLSGNHMIYLGMFTLFSSISILFAALFSSSSICAQPCCYGVAFYHLTLVDVAKDTTVASSSNDLVSRS